MTAKIVLKAEGEQYALRGALNIYNKWIDSIEGKPEPGDPVKILSPRGDLIGTGLYETHGAIGVRILSFEDENIDRAFILKRLRKALDRRRKLGFKNFFRLVHAEADMMPGLVVDVYNDIGVIQTSCTGFDKLIPLVAEVLADLTGVRSVYVRNDLRSRREIGLETYRSKVLGEDNPKTIIYEGKAAFEVDVIKGQKTGFYIDQRTNRLELENYSWEGCKVLDLFSYTGGFGIHAALKGAEVTFVDESLYAIETCKKNAKINDVADRCKFVQSRVKEFLQSNKEKFDIVIADPPALVPSREYIKNGVKAYFALNLNAMKTLKPGGLLFTSSCSHFVSVRFLKNIVIDSAKKLRLKPLFLGGVRGASPCHPVDPKNSGTTYLKAFFLILDALKH